MSLRLEQIQIHTLCTYRYTHTDAVQPLDASLFLSSGAVLSLTMGEDGESCYSGGLDGTVRCWKMPDLNVDPYDNYGRSSSTAEYLASNNNIPICFPYGFLNICVCPSRSWHREQCTGRPRGQCVGSHLLGSPPSSCLVLSRWHHSYLGPSELSSLPVCLQ